MTVSLPPVFSGALAYSVAAGSGDFFGRAAGRGRPAAECRPSRGCLWAWPIRWRRFPRAGGRGRKRMSSIFYIFSPRPFTGLPPHCRKQSVSISVPVPHGKGEGKYFREDPRPARQAGAGRYGRLSRPWAARPGSDGFRGRVRVRSSVLQRQTGRVGDFDHASAAALGGQPKGLPGGVHPVPPCGLRPISRQAIAARSAGGSSAITSRRSASGRSVSRSAITASRSDPESAACCTISRSDGTNFGTTPEALAVSPCSDSALGPVPSGFPSWTSRVRIPSAAFQ